MTSCNDYISFQVDINFGSPLTCNLFTLCLCVLPLSSQDQRMLRRYPRIENNRQAWWFLNNLEKPPSLLLRRHSVTNKRQKERLNPKKI
jgi:hypothetical protein